MLAKGIKPMHLSERLNSLGDLKIKSHLSSDFVGFEDVISIEIFSLSLPSEDEVDNDSN